MPKHQCQSTNAHANANAQWPAACGAAAPMESSAAGPRGALLAPPSVWALELVAVLLLLSVAEAVEETEAEAVEETEAEAVLLNAAAGVGGVGGGGHVSLTKKLTVHPTLSTSACVGMVDHEPSCAIAPPQQSVWHMSGSIASRFCCDEGEHL